nr:unnamed protein product [Callosobruchus analis]
MKQYNLDILAISEHHITNDELSNICFEGYKVTEYFSRTNHKNGGTAIIVRSTLEYNLANLSSLSVEGHSEICGINFTLDLRTVCIIVVYRPPSGDMNIFFETIVQALIKSSRQSDDIILCGDFNIDINKGDVNTKLLSDIFESFNLYITTKEPTRVFVNKVGHVSSSSIDYMTTSLPENAIRCDIVNPNIADHYAHVLSICRTTIKEKKVVKYNKRSFSDDNVRHFRDLVHSTDWSHLFLLNVEDSFTYIIDTIVWCLDVSCPMKVFTKSIHSESNLNKQWVNQDIVNQGNQLRDLFWLMSNFPSADIKKMYNYEKKRYRSNINETKRAYFSNKISISSNRAKATWSIVNKKLGRNNKNMNITLNNGTNLISENRELSNLFVDSFSSSAPNAVKEKFSYNLSLPCTRSEYQQRSLFITPVTHDELLDIFRSLKNKTSAGFDGLTINMLEEVKEVIIPLLVYLVNKSVETFTFPAVLKLAIVIPVHKKGDPEDIDNYRQISLLSVISKILEKFLYRRISAFASMHSILTTAQHGFQPKKSVETASCSYLDFIYTKLDLGKYVISLLFDLSKAFDTVDKKYLMDKLDSIGIRGGVLTYIQSYMENRKMQVKLGESMSSMQNIEIGVPQGSVLGPMLFYFMLTIYRTILHMVMLRCLLTTSL